MKMKIEFFLLTAGVAIVTATSCGGPDKAVSTPVAQYSPEDAILRIGAHWKSQESEKGFRSPPSGIASFSRQTGTELSLKSGETQTDVAVTLVEQFVLRKGETVACETVFSFPAEVAYGRRSGQPALELGWSTASIPRACGSSAAQIPAYEQPAGRARFVLRSDRLVGVEPALEKRQFIPVD